MYTESSHFFGILCFLSHAFFACSLQPVSIEIRAFATESPLSAFVQNSVKSRPSTGW